MASVCRQLSIIDHLKFDEFVERINQIVYVSATPGPYEMEVETNVAEQIIRPTGLLRSIH